MASIQSLLAIGAMALLALLSLRFNSTVLQNSTFEIENKVYLTAFSLADDMIEEIKQKAFDEKTVDFQAIKVSQLTTSANFGPDDGEVWPNFNDIDDYKEYTKEVNLPHAEGYNIVCSINYVDAEGQDLLIQSYFKKVIVIVSSDYLSNPVSLSFIFSLHSKN